MTSPPWFDVNIFVQMWFWSLIILANDFVNKYWYLKTRTKHYSLRECSPDMEKIRIKIIEN